MITPRVKETCALSAHEQVGFMEHPAETFGQSIHDDFIEQPEITPAPQQPRPSTQYIGRNISRAAVTVAEVPYQQAA